MIRFSQSGRHLDLVGGDRLPSQPIKIPVPKAILTIEQIAEQLEVDVEAVRQVAQPQS